MEMMYKIILLLFMISICLGRKHKINIDCDVRKYIALSTFGFYKRGFLDVKLINFTAKPMNKSDVFGFSLDRTQNDAMNPYLDSHQEKCLLKQNVPKEHDAAVIYFILNFNNNTMMVNCSPGWKQPLHIYKDSNDIPTTFFKTRSFEENKLIRVIRDMSSPVPHSCLHSLPLSSETVNNVTYYNTSFVIYVASDSEEGLYNLYFHSCPNYIPNNEVVYDFSMEIVEENAGSYLSAGWTFIKHVLAPRDKRLFMAIIPLQVLANMAEIILEESEEGAREYRAWQDVFILVDLLCCGFILFPVVWSIRHLEEASQTDGYKFRPAAHNPYFTLPSDDEEEEDEVLYSRLTENGATEGLSRVNSRSKTKTGQFITEISEEEGDALITKKENSHEYD
ncbi:hypothetical protein Trydic_g16277 [Trypoxylus dichotomus]